MIPYDRYTAIPCASEDIDKETAAACRKGCIGCGDCAANCPKGAVHVVGNLAVIDYDVCVGCTAAPTSVPDASFE
jgi:ferredoxin